MSVKVYRNVTENNKATASTKELLGENTPYRLGTAIDGIPFVMFNSHFLGCVRSALTEGCTARMGDRELPFWLAFVRYQDDMVDGIRNDFDITTASTHEKIGELALRAMNTWVINELVGNAHPSTTNCFVQ